MIRGHCWSTLLQQCKPRLLLDHTDATNASNCIIVTMPSDTVLAFYTVIAFVIPLIALLTSTPAMWHEEHRWNFSVLPRVHLSDLVSFGYSVFSEWLRTEAPSHVRRGWWIKCARDHVVVNPLNVTSVFVIQVTRVHIT
jgi:hypothetical protein